MHREQLGGAVDRLTRDEGQQHRVGLGVDDGAVGARLRPLDEDQVRVVAGGDAADLVAEPDDVGRVRSRHLPELLVGEEAAPLLLVDAVGDLELAEQVLRTRRRPVRRQRHLDAGLDRRRDVRGLAVEHDVRQRRPHDLHADLAHLLELRVGERRRVDADRLRLEEAEAAELLELGARRVIDALGEVNEEGGGLAVGVLGVDLGRLFRRDRRDREHVLADLVLAEVVELDVAHVRAGALQVDRPLNRGRPTDGGAVLTVLERLAHVVGALDRVVRRLDVRAVVLGARPLIAVVPLAARVPERQEVVRDVVVQVDEARGDDRVGLDHLGRWRHLVDRVDDRGDDLVLDDDVALLGAGRQQQRATVGALLDRGDLAGAVALAIGRLDRRVVVALDVERLVLHIEAAGQTERRHQHRYQGAFHRCSPASDRKQGMCHEVTI